MPTHTSPEHGRPANRWTLHVASVSVLAALALLGGSGVAVADPAPPAESVRFTVTQFDGTPPFDDLDPDGADSGPSNGVVRIGDSVTHVVDIVVGTAPLTDVQVNLPVPDGLSLGRIPAFCLPGSALVVGEDHEQSLQCRFGDLAAGTVITRTVITRADHPDATGTTAAPVVAALSSPSLPHPVLSDPVSLRYVSSTPVCDPRGIPAPDGPANGVTATAPVRADGRISVTIVDPSRATGPVALTGTDICGHRITRTVTPDSNAQVLFTGLMPGRYRVTATPIDGGPLPTDTAEVTVDQANPSPALTLPPTHPAN